MRSVLFTQMNPATCAALQLALDDKRISVRQCATGVQALEQVAAAEPGVVVIGHDRPDIDGGIVLRMLRAISNVPVIMIINRYDHKVVIDLLEEGADDCITQQCAYSEIVARICAQLRITGPRSDGSVLEVDELSVDLSAREASLAGRPVPLNRIEFDLIAYLARNAGNIVTRRELHLALWQTPVDDERLHVHVSLLRRKLGESAAKPRFIHTVRGIGLKLMAPSD